MSDYPKMIRSAIESLNKADGSSATLISKKIESAYPDLPADHSSQLMNYLVEMKKTGQLVMVNDNYKVQISTTPTRRGRGRPPKTKTSLSPGVSHSGSFSGRSRGRPPKQNTSATGTPMDLSSARPRGRPPKRKGSPIPGMVSPARPRGRPRKRQISPPGESQSSSLHDGSSSSAEDEERSSPSLGITESIGNAKPRGRPRKSPAM